MRMVTVGANSKGERKAGKEKTVGEREVVQCRATVRCGEETGVRDAVCTRGMEENRAGCYDSGFPFGLGSRLAQVNTAPPWQLLRNLFWLVA